MTDWAISSELEPQDVYYCVNIQIMMSMNQKMNYCQEFKLQFSRFEDQRTGKTYYEFEKYRFLGCKLIFFTTPTYSPKFKSYIENGIVKGT